MLLLMLRPYLVYIILLFGIYYGSLVFTGGPLPNKDDNDMVPYHYGERVCGLVDDINYGWISICWHEIPGWWKQ